MLPNWRLGHEKDAHCQVRAFFGFFSRFHWCVSKNSGQRRCVQTLTFQSENRSPGKFTLARRHTLLGPFQRARCQLPGESDHSVEDCLNIGTFGVWRREETMRPALKCACAAKGNLATPAFTSQRRLTPQEKIASGEIEKKNHPLGVKLTKRRRIHKRCKSSGWTITGGFLHEEGYSWQRQNKANKTFQLATKAKDSVNMEKR